MSRPHRSRPRIAAAALAAALSIGGLASTADLAAAQSGTLCRASAARGSAPDTATSEPVVANANGDPCVTDAAQSAVVEPQNGLTAVNPRANTVRSAGLVAASSSIESASGTSGGAVAIGVGAVSSQQTLACQGGASVASGTSRVESLTIGGTPVPGIIGSTPVDTTVPTPGGDIRIRANQVSTTAAGITRTGLILDFPGGGQQVYGEAIAGGDACLALPGAGSGAGSGSGSGANGGPQPCPSGAVYEADRNLCVIRQQVAGESDRSIVVGRPYQGPGGGTVIGLDDARKRFGATRCLTGKGPAFAVIGTNRADNVTGTNGRDRILTLGGNDRADGGRGDDCIDGGTGRDVLSGALGNDRVFGTAGNDSVNGGPGTDHLSGGTGADTLNAAFGRDVVLGGPGRDFINVATSGPAARVSCGSGRDKVRVNYNERARTTGCETRYVFNDRAKIKGRKKS